MHARGYCHIALCVHYMPIKLGYYYFQQMARVFNNSPPMLVPKGVHVLVTSRLISNMKTGKLCRPMLATSTQTPRCV